MAHTHTHTRFCAENNDKLIEYLYRHTRQKIKVLLNLQLLWKLCAWWIAKIMSAVPIHGMIFEILAEKLSTAKNVLCIRYNTGYVSSCMASMMGPRGTVFHIESIPDLKEKVKKTIKKTNPYLLLNKRIQLLF
ncbi:hypothetical protein TSAR_012842 [Trichomalopsis sarcophagae]|uniref:Uncharacterized protein n=1 Tax=Trichomalopsis sarcophagae TaxID=543379 RepID=A0A232EY89_9HYME|nr:hypothetical protein TSAR_012842 [Trichomalopsis sarcophagae]